MLTSHVRAMAHRSVTGEPLPEVEAELFDEISPDSMQLAREVVAQFGNLPDEEAAALRSLRSRERQPLRSNTWNRLQS